ncbi:unnamed protein product [Closterium sp. Yama58-4]|nr:unnamed protein product [Closterium sp. Yama58-4]
MDFRERRLGIDIAERNIESGAATLGKRRPCAMAHGGEGFGKVGADGEGISTEQPEPAVSRQDDDSAEQPKLDRTSSGASVDSNSSRSSHGGSSLVVISFYKFAQLDDCAALKRPLEQVCRQHRVSGGVIVAREGINGSICGTPDAAAAVIDWLRADARLAGLRTTVQPAGAEEREAHCAAEAMEAEELEGGGSEAEAVDGQSECSPLAAGRDAPFRWNHVRVKVKQEIVTLGMPEVNPADGVGTYVSAREWNDLISDPTTVVVDVRNDYETRIGAFHRAIDPNTRSFRQFPVWVHNHLPLPPSSPNSPVPDSPPSASTTPPNVASPPESPLASPSASPASPDSLPRVAMYCTGGIRCEKATAYMLHLGFPQVRPPTLPPPKPATPFLAACHPPFPRSLPSVPPRQALIQAGPHRSNPPTCPVPLPAPPTPSSPPPTPLPPPPPSSPQERVFHLDGGILRYLAEVPPEDSLWRGECFVFDKRVAVGHGMHPTTTYSLCYACQQPVDEADRQSPLWEAGVSCPHCHGSKSEDEKERARARQRQFERWGAVGGPGGEKAERAAERMRRRAERRKGGVSAVWEKEDEASEGRSQAEQRQLT